MTRRREQDRVLGMLLGAAVGDALGWPQEARGGLVGGQKARDGHEPAARFREWHRTAGRYSGRYRDTVRAGEYSDDTQLLCATARACLAGPQWFDRLTSAELPAWPLYQRGGGGAVLSAAAAWADRRPPWSAGRTIKTREAKDRYMNAGANGAAMRIAPHVVVAADPLDLTGRVLGDGLATHGHPRALVGAVLYAAALDRALRTEGTVAYGDLLDAAREGLVSADQAVAALPEGWGDGRDRDNFATTWGATCREAEQLLTTVADSLGRGAMSSPEATLEEIGSLDPKVNGAGTVTAVGAVYLASRFAARPTGGLVTAAFLRKADTDTLASMASALLGAVHGPGWLGTLADTVQDSGYLAWLAGELTNGASEPPPAPDAPAALLRKRIVKDLPPSGEASSGTFPDGRHYRLLDIEEIDHGRAVRARLILGDGQTVLIDRAAERLSSPAPRRPGADPPRPASTAPGAAVRLTLATGQLAACAAFYAKLLGADVPVVAGAANVAPWLVLRQADTGPPPDGRLVITLAVPDPKQALARVGVEAQAADDGAFRARDPDGRHLRLERPYA